MSMNLVISMRCMAAKLLIVVTIVSSSTATLLLAEEFDEFVLAALEREKGLQLVDATLSDIAQLLEYRLNVNTVVDQKALEDDAIPTDTLISVDLNTDVSLKSALAIALDSHDLDFTISNGSLLLTTQTASAEKGYARAHFVEKRLRTGELDGELNELANAVVDSISPDEWEQNGGNANIEGHSNQLVVSGPLRLQDEVHQFLGILNRAEKEKRGRPTRLEEKIRQKLAVSVDLDVRNITLENLAAHCQELAGVPFVVNQKALEDDAVPLDTQVSATFQDLGLGRSLRLMLEQVDLSWIIHDEVVYITTQTGAAETQVTSCIPIGDLTAGQSEHIDELTNLIENSVEVTTWECNGGNSSISWSPSGRVLILSTTEDATEQVEQFLAHVRRGWDAEAFARQNKRPETQFYLVNVPGITAGQVVTFLKSEASGIRWDSQSSCTLLGDRIAVRNRRAEHGKIDRLLLQLSSTGRW